MAETRPPGRPERILIDIATTGGPATVRAAEIDEEAARSSMVLFDQNYVTAGVDDIFDGFDRRLRKRLAGLDVAIPEGGLILEVDQPIDAGQSWQLGLTVLHAAMAAGKLAVREEEATRLVWATGAIGTSAWGAKPVEAVPLKLERSAARFQELLARGIAVDILVPRDQLEEAEALMPAGASLRGIDDIAPLVGEITRGQPAAPRPDAPETPGGTPPRREQRKGGAARLAAAGGAALIVLGAGVWGVIGGGGTGDDDRGTPVVSLLDPPNATGPTPTAADPRETGSGTQPQAQAAPDRVDGATLESVEATAERPEKAEPDTDGDRQSEATDASRTAPGDELPQPRISPPPAAHAISSLGLDKAPVSAPSPLAALARPPAPDAPPLPPLDRELALVARDYDGAPTEPAIAARPSGDTEANGAATHRRLPSPQPLEAEILRSVDEIPCGLLGFHGVAPRRAPLTLDAEETLLSVSDLICGISLTARADTTIGEIMIDPPFAPGLKVEHPLFGPPGVTLRVVSGSFRGQAALTVTGSRPDGSRFERRVVLIGQSIEAPARRSPGGGPVFDPSWERLRKQ